MRNDDPQKPVDQLKRHVKRDGTHVFSGTLNARDGARLFNAIDAEIDTLAQTQRAPKTETTAATALVRLADRGLGAGPNPASTRSHRHRRRHPHPRATRPQRLRNRIRRTPHGCHDRGTRDVQRRRSCPPSSTPPPVTCPAPRTDPAHRQPGTTTRPPSHVPHLRLPRLHNHRSVIARCTTSTPGTTAAPPTSTTSSRCAPDITTSSTKAAGPSTSTPTAPSTSTNPTDNTSPASPCPPPNSPKGSTHAATPNATHQNEPPPQSDATNSHAADHQTDPPTTEPPEQPQPGTRPTRPNSPARHQAPLGPNPTRTLTTEENRRRGLRPSRAQRRLAQRCGWLSRRSATSTSWVG